MDGEKMPLPKNKYLTQPHRLSGIKRVSFKTDLQEKIYLLLDLIGTVPITSTIVLLFTMNEGQSRSKILPNDKSVLETFSPSLLIFLPNVASLFHKHKMVAVLLILCIIYIM